MCTCRGCYLLFSDPHAKLRYRAVPDRYLTFPDFTKKGLLFQPNLIFPVPAEFISPNLPRCATVRPITDKFGGATAAITGLTASGLFTGQSKNFFNTLKRMAAEADAAVRNA